MWRATLLLLLVAACSDQAHPPLQSNHPGSGGSSASLDSGGSPDGQSTHADATNFLEGETLDGSVGWQGYAAGSAVLGKLSVADYEDADGSRGVRALLIQEISVTCPACKLTTSELPARLNGGWGAGGVQILQLVILDPQMQWAEPDDAKGWKDAWSAPWGVAADPGFSFSRAGTNALPVQVLVDPKTLTIVRRTEGYQSSYPELEALIAE